MPVTYVKGDATCVHVTEGLRIIAHVCNNIGGFGSGFAACVAKRWPIVKFRYKLWHKRATAYTRFDGGQDVTGADLQCDECGEKAEYFGGQRADGSPRTLCSDHNMQTMPLGEIQLVKVEDNHGIIFVANMVAQDGYVSESNPVALRYDHLMTCLMKLGNWVRRYKKIRRPMYMHRPDSTRSTIHMPRIGCGLAGGEWSEVAKCVEGLLGIEHDVYIYDLYDQEGRE